MLSLTADPIRPQDVPEEARSADWRAAERRKDAANDALRAAALRDDATDEELELARAAYWAAFEAWWEIAQRDGARHASAAQADANAAREAQLVAAPFEAALGRAVALLRREGPLASSEIEARRMPGVSRNSLRPVLRAAVDRGLVRKERSGKRVIWAAVATDEEAAA